MKYFTGIINVVRNSSITYLIILLSWSQRNLSEFDFELATSIFFCSFILFGSENGIVG